MELWIRSQDKTRLSIITNIQLVEWGGEYSLIGYTNDYVDDFDLGKYQTKERALEVLDEIQNILNLKNMYKYDRELVLKGWKNVDGEQVKIVRQQMSVYEMPKD